jgi:glucoamylase
MRALRRTATIAASALAGALIATAPAPAQEQAEAPGAPGARTVWAPADKHGFGSARQAASRVWFTLRAHELTEVYYPDLGTPAVRDLQFAVASGRRVVRETTGRARVSRGAGLAYTQVVDDRRGRWRLTKRWSADPRRSALVARVALRSLDGRPHRLFLLADPALSNEGDDDRGATRAGALLSFDADAASSLRAKPALRRTSSGYAGRREPWRTLRRTGRPGIAMDAPRPGNVRQLAATALDGRRGRRAMTLVLGFGATAERADRTAKRSLRAGHARAAAGQAAGWRRYLASLNPAPAAAAPVARAYETSLLVLAAAEDKRNPGAHVASPSMPWAWGRGTVERDLPSGPYHLVWSRDLYQAATAQLAAGDRDAALRLLDFLLFRQQRDDGSFPQNSTVDGRPRWRSTQLDEVAFPLVLAWQLGAADARRWPRLRAAAEYVLRAGPGTPQERWENQEGFSPATIAAEVAGLVCAADLARRNGDGAAAARYEATADAWAASVEGWTATTNGPYAPRPYYLRLTKDRRPDAPTTYSIGDGGPERADQRAVVDPSFLELVRLGVKRHDDPAIVNTVAVVDGQLRVQTPQGPLWHRFTFDGYGETRGGGDWDLSEPGSGRTLGRVWPIFAGERGEYELAAGRRDAAAALLLTLAGSANDGGMIAEQVWDGRPPTGADGGGPLGTGTRSATPLAWSHAQLVRLVWSLEAGRPVERPAIVACRYLRIDC